MTIVLVDFDKAYLRNKIKILSRFWHSCNLRSWWHSTSWWLWICNNILFVVIFMHYLSFFAQLNMWIGELWWLFNLKCWHFTHINTNIYMFLKSCIAILKICFSSSGKDMLERSKYETPLSQCVNDHFLCLVFQNIHYTSFQ